MVRALARDVSLLLCAAVGSYLLGVWVAARLALALAAVLRGEGIVLRVIAGAVALDLSKAPGLLAAGWLVGRAVAMRPTFAAAVLVLLSYGLDVAVALLLQQHGWLWGQPGLLLCRAAIAVLLVWLVGLVLSRRRRGSAAFDRAPAGEREVE